MGGLVPYIKPAQARDPDACRWPFHDRSALRMFHVYPIFRSFNIEPPKFITRYIRRAAKGTDTFTPLFLSALTVFISGVTQAMMFAFTLDTSPVFFIEKLRAGYFYIDMYSL